MKKNVFYGVFFVLMFVAEIAFASWESVYQNVKDAYIYDVSIDDLASISLKGLNNIDKKVTVGSGANTISLYYKGSVIDSVKKPEDENDIKKWSDITKRFIDKAIEKSTLASENNFHIFDTLVKEIPKVLDDDSKFFDSFDEARGISVKNKRIFAERIEDDVLIVKIVLFNKHTATQLKKSVEENIDAKAIVFDLRGCLGGMSSEAIITADLFLDSGIITSMRGKNQGEEIYYTAKEDIIWDNKPVFILVDANTASAAEIFTSALKEQGIAKVVGTLTKGKGSMQKLVGLETGSVLAITNSFFKTPANNEIHNNGIAPDICTFEVQDTKNIDNLLKQKHNVCYKESRENTILELEIVKKLLKKTSDIK